MFHRWLTELRRRRVLRVAGAYVVAGWGVLQAAGAVVPLLGLPDWAVTLVALLLLAGLPVSLATVWALQGAEQAVPAEAPRAGWVDFGLLAAVLGVMVISLVQVSIGGGRPSPAQAGGLPPPSVAVLPLASFSDDPADGYFTDGLTEELINSLAQIEGLKVPGRTSSFFFKGRNEDLRDIARQLGVGHVLEGSVRRAGEQLRVTVQLVSAADGFHLWSQTYDRRLTDVLAIQFDIAEQVARTLESTLLAENALAAAPSRRESYPDFLVATALLRERSRESLTEARRLFEAMLADDPDQVEALAGFAQASILLAGAYLTLEFEPAAAAAAAAAERAVALAPQSRAANLAAGAVYDVLAQRTDEHQYLVLAERFLARAVDLAPADAEALRAYGALLARQQRWEAAVALTGRAVASDPLDRGARLQHAEALRGIGRLADARAELERVVHLYPDYVPAHQELGELFMETGILDAAVAHLRIAHAERSSPRASFALANVYLNLGMSRELTATLAELDYAPLTRPLVQMVRLHAAGDDGAALRHGKAELARSGDRIWRPPVVLAALNTGNLAVARENLRQLEPQVLGPAPDLARIPAATVLLAATLLLAEEHTEQAAALLEGLLARHAPAPGGFDPPAAKLVRAQALAGLGRHEEALVELADARRQGYRTLYDFDNFLRLDRYPIFAGLRDDPRFVALLSAIEAENRQLAQRLASA